MKSPQVCAKIIDLDEKFVTEVSKLSNYLNSLEPVNEIDGKVAHDIFLIFLVEIF